MDTYSGLGDWQWESSADALSDWNDLDNISVEDSSNYTPGDADVGMYLRAYATYLDSDGVLMRGLSSTIGPVQAAPE